MASLVLGVAGAYVGSMFGPFGASIGWAIGASVGGMLDPQKTEGPRLTDLKLQASQYGGMIPIVFGTNRLTGNVVWQTDLQEASHTSGGKGGGGPKITTYTYSASWAVRLCEGPDVVVKRVWADGRLVWAEDGSATSITFTQYPGSETQLPDPTMEAELGVGNVNAMRGVAYVVFANVELDQFGNRLPNLSFEVSTIPLQPGIREVLWRRDLPMAFGSFDNEVSYTHGDMPRINAWPTAGTDPIVIFVTSALRFAGGAYGHIGTVKLDQDTLDVISADLGANPGFDREVQDTGPQALSYYDTITTVPQYQYAYIGQFMGEPLWLGMGILCVDRSSYTSDQATAYGAMAQSRPYFPVDPDPPYHSLRIITGTDPAFAWGLPDGFLINAAILSNDGLCLLVVGCTTPTGTWEPGPYVPPGSFADTVPLASQYPGWSGSSDRWYKIMGGAVVDNGTISGGFAQVYGNASWGVGPHQLRCGSMENNYEWIWVLATNAQFRIWHIGDDKVLREDSATKTATDTYWLNAYYGGGTGYTPFQIRTSDGWPYTNGIVHNDRVNLPLTPADATPTGAWLTTDAGSFMSILCTPGERFCGCVHGNYAFLLERESPSSEGITLGEIVAAISEREEVAMTSDQYDVSELTDIVPGYTIGSQSTARACIEMLQPAYFFDAVESDAKVKFVKRGGDSVVTIAENDLGAVPDDSEPVARITRTRGQELDLPQRVDVAYIDKDADYQNGAQESQRMVGGARNAISINVAVAIDALKAKQIADAQLFSAWYGRDRARLQLPMKYAYLDPCDTITVRDRLYRINDMTAGADRVMKLALVAELPSIWFQVSVPAPGQGIVPQTPATRQLTDLILLDIPYIVDVDHQQVYYAAMAGHDRASWAGAALYKSIDSGTTYDQIAVDNAAPDVMGTASTVLSDWTGGNVFDETNSVTVVIGNGGGDLDSVTREAVLNGANEFVLGDEIIRARTCTLTGTLTYVLSGLLRGRRGTEWATGTHVVGERFVALPVATTLDAVFGEYNASRKYKPVTVGSTLTESPPQDFTNTGIILKSYAPVQLYGGRNAAGDIVLNWRRRARFNNVWLEGIEVPLDEPTERYMVRFWGSSTYATLVYEELHAGPPFNYSAADQTTDFGSPQSTLYWSVRQLGVLGEGYEARGVT